MALSMQGTSLESVCEVLVGVQSPDAATRQAAEQHLSKALREYPDGFVRQLVVVLATRNGSTPEEMRQESSVLLRQCIAGTAGRVSVWKKIEPNTVAELKKQLLVTLEQDPATRVRRSASQVVAALAGHCGEDFASVNKEWPELLGALSHFVSGSDPTTRVVALATLKELTAQIGDGLLESGGTQVATMIQGCLTDQNKEVRAAGAQLVLQLIEDLPSGSCACLRPLIPPLVATIQSLATSDESLLKDVLESLISAADEEPEFFKDCGLQSLWPLLMQMCRAGAFADEDARHSAMEALMSFVCGLAEDFCKAEGLPLLEQILTMNVDWMLEVEEDVAVWNARAEDDDDEEIDGDAVQIAEENLDRLAEQCAAEKTLEEAFLPALFKVIRGAMQAPNSSWKHVRAAVICVSQVVEHIEEESWIDQSVEFILQHVNHSHPRVRQAAFSALGQVAYDHDPYVAENHPETVLPAIAAALDDPNVRVATAAATAFTSLGDSLDSDDLEPHMDELMAKLFLRLQKGETRAMQEQCLAAIAVVGEVSEELFVPHYTQVMPVLKQILERYTGEDQRMLRCKAFECISLIGDAVGKETFINDARAVMGIMVTAVQSGFAPDDQTREYIHEAAGRVAATLGKDFKPYVPAFLPGMLAVLAQRPAEVEPSQLPDEDDDEDEMVLRYINDKVVGLKTAAIEEMKMCLLLITTLVEALEEDFVEFLPATCEQLLQLLDFQISDEIRDKAFDSWEVVINCARRAAEHGKCDRSDVAKLLSAFLQATVKLMNSAPQGAELTDSALTALQAQAAGISGVIEKAGPNVLSKADVTDMMKVVLELLNRVSVNNSEPAESGSRRQTRRLGGDMADDDDDEDEEEQVATRQTVRFCLADIAGSLMRSNRQDFTELALPTLVSSIQPMLSGNNEADRSLALYLADDIVEALGELSVPFWDRFVEQACTLITDKNPVVRQYAASTIGNAAAQPVFAKAASVAATQLGTVLVKFGERHRRRRAVNEEAKEVALAVDAAIKALGSLLEHQEQHIQGDTAAAWKMWLRNLPLRYDKEEGHKAHQQLLRLVVKNHPVVTAPEQLPQVLAIFADVYRTKFSNEQLDRDIAKAIASAGAATVARFGAGLQEKQRKRVEAILKDGQGRLAELDAA